jgi:hypothetical protein
VKIVVFRRFFVPVFDNHLYQLLNAFSETLSSIKALKRLGDM